MAESIETPFRICDEFDVYMDAVARATAFHLIVAAAENAKYRQVICITCKDLRSTLACTVSKFMWCRIVNDWLIVCVFCFCSDLEKSHKPCYTIENCVTQTMSET